MMTYTRARTIIRDTRLSAASIHDFDIDNDDVEKYAQVSHYSRLLSTRTNLADFEPRNYLKGIFFQPLCILLLLTPLAAFTFFRSCGPLVDFGANFLMLIPLSKILGDLTEELALHFGEIVGGFLNATLGNTVEMILTVVSLRSGLYAVVKGSLIGSIFGNLLLVLGMSFFVGGIKHHELTFNSVGASFSTSMLLMAFLAMAAPTVATVTGTINGPDILTMSRLLACLTAVAYILCLIFQLYTHNHLFLPEDLERPPHVGDADDASTQISRRDNIGESPVLSVQTCLVTMTLVTLWIAFHSEILVESIGGVVDQYSIPYGFIGVILLPIVGNAAEHATSVIVAAKNKPDLSISIAMGSSAQIAMFMVPFATICGWWMGIPFNMVFDLTQCALLFISILLTLTFVGDGKTNWAEGGLLMIAYLVIAIVQWFSTDVGSV